jgi:ABC-type dipeptide/oligopeptide/nickel transport system permease component
MLALTLLVFALVRVTGDPLNLLLPENATDADFARVSAELALDQPIPVQYVRFLGQAVSGNFGTSIFLKVPVSDLVAQRFPYTLQLAAFALLLIICIAVPLGIYSAYWRGGKVDRVARSVAAIGQSAPNFWIGLILIVVVAVNLRLLPPGGYGGLDHLILPGVTIALVATAGLMRLIRSSMLEVLGSDYVKFLRIKGLPEGSVLWKHSLRNAGLSALTLTGVLTATLLTGSVVVERVFVWPGVGSLLADSIEKRDFPVVEALVLLFSFLYIAINLIVDLLYLVLNPRLSR